MSIPLHEIEEWSRQGGSTRPEWTHQVLRDALAGAPRLKDVDYEIFLQGSYANDTNLPADSDVDLVVQMKLPFEEDIRRLNAFERKLFYERYEDTDYGWEFFREDVLATLRERFFVTESRRCVDITDLDSLVRVPADVLPAIEFRRYAAIRPPFVEDYEEGVYFRDSAGHPIVNFPKQHLRNGRRKDRDTGGRFKQVVRAVKSARKHESAGSAAAEAPSYFVECLLYNVDDACFRADRLDEAYRSCLTWLVQIPDATLRRLLCQNELVEMFGPRPEQWEYKECADLIRGLDLQWTRWGQA